MSQPANQLRGEACFAIGQARFTLRPSFENLVAAEDELGSLFALIERASQGALGLGEITSLIWHCLPSEERPARALVGEAVLAKGVVAALQPVRVILAEALQGSQ